MKKIITCVGIITVALALFYNIRLVSKNGNISVNLTLKNIKALAYPVYEGGTQIAECLAPWRECCLFCGSSSSLPGHNYM